MTQKKYELKKDSMNKAFNVTLRGRFTTEEGMEFVDQYQKAIGGISNKPDTLLVIDCNEMQLVSSDVTDALEYCFTLYRDSGFKDVVFDITKNPKKSFFKMQFNRLAKSANLKMSIRE